MLSPCSAHGGQQRALYSKSQNYRYLCFPGCVCWDVSPAPSYTHSSFCTFGVTARGIQDFASVREVIYHWVLSTFTYLWVKIYFILIMLCVWECAHVSAGDCRGQEWASDHWSWNSRQSWTVLGTSMRLPAESSLQSWILSLVPRISPSCWTLVFEVGYEESTVPQQHFLKGPWWWFLFPVPRWHILSIARSLLTVSRHIQFLHQHSAIFQPVLTFQLWDAELFRDSVHSGTLFYSWGPRTWGSWSCPMGSVMVSSGWILQSR